MAIKTNENFITFSNSETFRKPRGTDLVTASELIGQSQLSRPRGRFARSKARQGDSLRHQIPSPCPHSPPTGFTLIGALYWQAKLRSIDSCQNGTYGDDYQKTNNVGSGSLR